MRNSAESSNPNFGTSPANIRKTPSQVQLFSTPSSPPTGSHLPKGERPYILSVHDEHFSPEDLVIAPELFPQLKPGDLVEIYAPEKRTKKVLFKIPSPSPLKGLK